MTMNISKQQQEIQTIAPRTITLNLSTADCERIAIEAGVCGLTVPQLLENFIGDLCCGTYSNGSDERDYARRYVERCWFGSGPNESLLQAMLAAGEGVSGVKQLLATIDDLAVCERDLATAEDAEERQAYQDDVDGLKEELAYYSDYYPDMTDLAAEIEKCRQWMREMQKVKESDQNVNNKTVSSRKL